MTGRGRIVVVEDDDSMRKALQRLLKAAGFEVVGYPSAEAMLRVEPDALVDCLVCDHNLPGMSGLALLAHLRDCALLVPMVLITGYDRPGLREITACYGVYAYLTKPFAGAALIATVMEAIAPHRSV